VVGLPVGFVNAAESKQMLTKTNVAHITNMGRKGGSAVAAAVINALFSLAAEKGA
jgi:precorrin-8X/cobalt-precorrin-8 methylmutase